MHSIDDWAARWGIPAAALIELRQALGTEPPPPAQTGDSEAAAQAVVRVEASRLGLRLWRNNVGVAVDERGQYVRYGLANESQAVNRRLKSSDLIGIRPVTIGPQHVGKVLGQFVSREIKRPGWTYRGSAREAAQLRWLELVAALGGDAAFATGEGTL